MESGGVTAEPSVLSPFGCSSCVGSSGQGVEIPAVVGVLKVFYHNPSGSGSADQQGAQSPVQHREQTGNSGLGRSLFVFSIVGEGEYWSRNFTSS